MDSKKTARTNIKILSNKNRRIPKNSKPVDEILFDEKARLEFLTGFERRNKEKKKKAIERDRILKSEAKSIKRKNKREKITSAIKTFMGDIQTPEFLTEPSITAQTIEHTEEGIKTTIIEVQSLRQTKEMSPPPAFKEKYDLAERIRRSTCLREQYIDRIPIICEKLGNSDFPSMDSERLLVPGEFTVGNLSTQSIFLFVNNALLPANQLLSTVYQQRKDADGFFYVLYSGENTFGSLK